MPKEKVYSRQFLPETEESPTPRLMVEVGWSKEQELVQIATVDGGAPEVVGASMTNFTFDQINRYADRLAEPITHLPDATTKTFDEVSGSDLDTDIIGEMVPLVHRGWVLTLDRNGINQLIRLLRKARDGAYGQDA